MRKGQKWTGPKWKGRGISASVIRRIFQKIEWPPDMWLGCWIWKASKIKGYGYIGNSRLKYVHRETYRFFIGDVPNGKELDHRCRETACVNPWHLEPVTHKENCLRGVSPAAIRAKQTECVHGHPLEVNPSRPSTRFCRTCKHLADARYRRRLGKQTWEERYGRV